MTHTRSVSLESVQHGASRTVKRPDWLEYEEFPFDLHVVEIDGNQVHYVDEGTGPVLLFVHAGPAWSFVFRDVIEQLRHEFRCIALDFPGSGLSESSSDYTPTIENASGVLESFVDVVGLDEVTLIAHDVGGPVAFGVIVRQPERFAGACVVGSFAWPLTEEFPAVARFIRIVSGSAFGVVNTNANLLARLTARFGVGRRLSKRGRRAFLGPFRDRQKRRNGVAMLGNVLESDDYLRNVDNALPSALSNRPLFLLFGENDEGRQAGFQDAWEVRYPDARSGVVDAANHFPMTDAPHFVAEEIAAWYAEAVGAPA